MKDLGSSIVLRRAVNDDIDAVIKLVFDVLNEYKLKPSPNDTDSDLHDLENNYFNRGGEFIVLIHDNEIVGCAGLYPQKNGIVELRKMYFDKSIRGRGIGKKVLEYCIDSAREKGFESITLETASVLVEAISLYQKYGFTEYFPEHLSNRCDQAFELKL